MKPIPDERFAPEFTTRRIRSESESTKLAETLRLLEKFVHEGDGMLVSELADLHHALMRATVTVQTAKHAALLKKMHAMPVHVRGVAQEKK